MATSAREPASDRLFDYLIERQTSLFDAVRGSAERYHRFNRSVIESARQSTVDWTEVGRRWLANPGDLIGTYEAASELAAWPRAELERSATLARPRW